MATDAGTEEDEPPAPVAPAAPATPAAPGAPAAPAAPAAPVALAAASSPLAHKTVVFTGTLQMLRADAVAAAVQAGAKVGSTITKNTDILVAAWTLGGLPSAKENAARAKGVEIWTEAQFFATAAAAAAAAHAPTPAAAVSSTAAPLPAASTPAPSPSGLGPLADGESKEVRCHTHRTLCCMHTECTLHVQGSGRGSNVY